MSVEKATSKRAAIEARKKRVNRIKKMIIAIIIIFLLLPSLLCITLWIKVSMLEKKLNAFMKEYSIEYVEAGDPGVGVDDTVIAAEITPVVPTDVPKEEDQTLIEGKKVYLTFDDGPSDNTEKILEILKETKTKATFFVIGHTDEHSKAMYRRIYEEGHTLAMHSYTHQYQKIYQSVNAYKKDMTKLYNLLYDITGQKPKFIRFPGGSSNTVSNVDMKDIILYTKKAGYTYFDWNVINGDATGQTLSDEQMINNVISGVDMYDSSVVLMHDCAGKEQTVRTLPAIIKKLKKMKVTMLPINDTTTLVQHIKADEVK